MTDVKKLRELLNRASAGPWEASNYLVFFADNAGGFSLSACPQRDDNAALIAGAVNALPALVDELERKDVEVARLDAECNSLASQLNRSNERNGVLREALQLLLHEVDESAIAGAQDYGWPTAVAKSRAALNPTTGEGHGDAVL